ncbi:MAG: MmcQ/YjbR family DNA-binding protein [Pseudomonadota bacterium]
MNLNQARAYAMSLPEASEEAHFEFTSFRIRGKIFASAPPDGAFLHVFVDEALRDPLIAANPEQFSALLWGAKVVGVKIKLPAARSSVELLLRESWKRKAPKKLVSLLP